MGAMLPCQFDSIPANTARATGGVCVKRGLRLWTAVNGS